MQPLISVVIPCFNNAAFIRKCVESVLAQDYKNLEIIVVDDGSDDDPAKALADVSDSRLKPVIRISHQGVSASRNIGIEYADGEYILLLTEMIGLNRTTFLH